MDLFRPHLLIHRDSIAVVTVTSMTCGFDKPNENAMKKHGSKPKLNRKQPRIQLTKYLD